jgi:hypothetical protein
MRRVIVSVLSFLIRDLTRLTAVASIAILLVAAVGVPLPVSTTKDRSVPFPCMDRACGCRSAAECKEKCCCFTREQKLAWAETRGVDPSTIVDQTSASPARSCCSSGRKPSPAPTCPHCGQAQSKAPASPAHATSKPEAPQRMLVVLPVERQCQGLDDLWLILAAASLPPATVEIPSADTSATPFSMPLFSRPANVWPAPPSPPPELV